MPLREASLIATHLVDADLPACATRRKVMAGYELLVAFLEHPQLVLRRNHLLDITRVEALVRSTAIDMQVDTLLFDVSWTKGTSIHPRMCWGVSDRKTRPVRRVHHRQRPRGRQVVEPRG